MPPNQRQTGQNASQIRRHTGLIGFVIAWIAFWHQFFVRWAKSLLDSAEETLNSLLRESLSITQRALNGASAWTLSVFNRGYKTQLRGRWQVLQEQYSWWGQTETSNRRSTLNAVLARKYDADASAAQGSPPPPTATATAAPAGCSSRSTAAQAGLRQRKQHTSEIEPLPQGDGSQQQQHYPQRRRSAGGGRVHDAAAFSSYDTAAAAAGGAQWWGNSTTWLSGMADEATEAAAAAQEAATAAVQQAATSMTQAVEEAAAAAASWARSMRAVFVEPPPGWGVHEAIKQTGLLEDVSLHAQLFISSLFDKLRWLLGRLTFSSISSTPTAAVAARQRASAAGLHQLSSGGVSGGGRSSSSGISPAAASAAAAGGGAAAPAGLFGRLRSAVQPGGGAAGRRGGRGAASGYGGRGAAGGVTTGSGGRLKLRSVTSVDLPRARRMSLEFDANDESDDQAGYAADESACSDSSDGSYDDVLEDASSEASCSSSTSSWAPQQPATAGAAGAAGAVLAPPPVSPDELAEMPSLTVRVPPSVLNTGGHSSSSGGNARAGQGRVSFAADRDRQGLLGSSSLADHTPFATMHVQEQHRMDIAQQQQQPLRQRSTSAQQHLMQGSTGSPPAAAGRAGRSHSSSTSKRRQQQQRVPSATGPDGLGAVLPARNNRRLQRSHSGPAVSVLRDVSSAGQVIRMAGYPLEVHEVITPDGYLLRMERIPLPTSTDAVFMMHGVLDTSLTWVAGGITGSQAFAAWDRGFDVWLGTTRSNPPHEAADPSKKGSPYWVYSHNEVGMYDMGAQIDHIHAVKMRELTALGRSGSSSSRRASSTAASARTSRRPSGRRSSGSTTASRRPIPEQHADILAGVVDADALVGIQMPAGDIAGSAGAAAAGGRKSIDADGAGGGAPGAGAAAEEDAPHTASSAPAASVSTMAAGVSGVSGSGRPGSAAVNMSRAQSAAEIDQAAAVDAAAAFTRHRAALAAAGITPGGLSSSAAAGGLSEKQTQHGEGQQQQQQQTTAGVLSDLTPTATAAAAAAARAANALGSAVASAAAAAGGMIGIGAAAGVTAVAGSAAQQQQQAVDTQTDTNRCSSDGSSAGCNVAVTEVSRSGLPAKDSSSSSNNNTVSARPAASGLLERLLGGTVPVEDEDRGAATLQRLQSQGSSMRHVSSAPDVSALADVQRASSTAASPSKVVEGGAAGPPPLPPTQQQQQQGGPGSSTASVDALSLQPQGSAGLGLATSGSITRRARRGSWPYGTSSSSLADAAAAAGDDAAGSSSAQQQAKEGSSGAGVQKQQQQQQQQVRQLQSPFSQQQPPRQPAMQPAAAALPDKGTEHVQQQVQQQQQDQQQRQQPQQRRQASGYDASSAVPVAAAQGGPVGSGSGLRAVRSSSWGVEPRPYNLRVVCHSLGGMLLLIYCTQRARAGRPHHVSRLILLSPAGFHSVIPSLFKPLVYVWRPLMLWTKLVWRQQGFPVHLPTFVARLLAFKLSVDSSKLPAVGDLLRSMARLLLGGDRSAWDRALLMPHYTAAGMPLLSSRQVLHFIQLYLTGRCQLFDYGSEAANVAAYHQRTPPVVSDAYHTLRDVPVHLVAGEHDGVIPASNIQQHYAAMKAAGMDVSYRQFDYGHMDFTFSSKEELGWYVMSLLMRT